jgi:leader peptidase (prepilin peptidase) / N-methyltransferase
MAFIWIDVFWLAFVFCVGACIGSLLNVVAARLPLEKSILWPGSRCGSCLQPIRGSANIPILSYLLLRGRCRNCKARFSSRYMWVELGVAVAFAGLFYFDILQNGNELDFVRDQQGMLRLGRVPWQLLALFVHHATLLSFLIAASLCDLDGKIIPLPLTMTGTAIGLIFATLMPWAWPSQMPDLAADQPWAWLQNAGKVPRGVYNWPFWGPPPDWAPRGSWQIGLLTGLAGAAAGSFMMRTVKFLFERGMGREALGLGDADLMMMVGAFLGWQMVVVSFFLGTFAALFFALPMAIWRRQNILPFGPGLAAGAILTMLFWHSIGPSVQPFFFDWFMILFAGFFIGSGMIVFSSVLGWRKQS